MIRLYIFDLVFLLDIQLRSEAIVVQGSLSSTGYGIFVHEILEVKKFLMINE